MERYFSIGFTIIIFAFLVSCFQEDEQIKPLPVDETDIPYSMYEYQAYFSIQSKSIVSYHHYDDWDLGFESNKHGTHIILNYAKFMYAGNTHSTDFYSVQTNTATEMKFDPSSGNLENSALNDWINLSNPDDTTFTGYVYIIDLGKDESGNEFGFKKVVFETLQKDTFLIHFANLDNSEEHYFTIVKDTTKNFVLFSFSDGGEIKTEEPAKETWDISFTKYATIIPDDFGNPTDYLVRGVYLNRFKNIKVAVDTIHHYYEITSEMIDNYEYSSDQDAIGYNWKVFENNVYKIRDYHSYILKNVNGVNYKLRFTDFFNDEGERGYPSFELMELE